MKFLVLIDSTTKNRKELFIVNDYTDTSLHVSFYRFPNKEAINRWGCYYNKFPYLTRNAFRDFTIEDLFQIIEYMGPNFEYSKKFQVYLKIFIKNLLTSY